MFWTCSAFMSGAMIVRLGLRAFRGRPLSRDEYDWAVMKTLFFALVGFICLAIQQLEALEYLLSKI